jgi:hypothetical protein
VKAYARLPAAAAGAPLPEGATPPALAGDDGATTAAAAAIRCSVCCSRGVSSKLPSLCSASCVCPCRPAHTVSGLSSHNALKSTLCALKAYGTNSAEFEMLCSLRPAEPPLGARRMFGPASVYNLSISSASSPRRLRGR